MQCPSAEEWEDREGLGPAFFTTSIHLTVALIL